MLVASPTTSIIRSHAGPSLLFRCQVVYNCFRRVVGGMSSCYYHVTDARLRNPPPKPVPPSQDPLPPTQDPLPPPPEDPLHPLPRSIETGQDELPMPTVVSKPDEEELIRELPQLQELDEMWNQCNECGDKIRSAYHSYSSNRWISTYIMSNRICCSMKCLRDYCEAKCSVDISEMRHERPSSPVVRHHDRPTQIADMHQSTHAVVRDIELSYLVCDARQLP